jgi:hypothetical protein
MRTVYEIPLSSKAQFMAIELGAILYKLNFYWNAPNATWMLDIADANDVPLVQGIPIVTGLDLLAPYKYLGFVGSLVVQTDTNPDAVPTYANLGTTGHVFFVVQ